MPRLLDSSDPLHHATDKASSNALDEALDAIVLGAFHRSPARTINGSSSSIGAVPSYR